MSRNKQSSVVRGSIGGGLSDALKSLGENWRLPSRYSTANLISNQRNYCESKVSLHVNSLACDCLPCGRCLRTNNILRAALNRFAVDSWSLRSSESQVTQWWSSISDVQKAVELSSLIEKRCSLKLVTQVYHWQLRGRGSGCPQRSENHCNSGKSRLQDHLRLDVPDWTTSMEYNLLCTSYRIRRAWTLVEVIGSQPQPKPRASERVNEAPIPCPPGPGNFRWHLSTTMRQG